jgi:hypothetical protein
MAERINVVLCYKECTPAPLFHEAEQGAGECDE